MNSISVPSGIQGEKKDKPVVMYKVLQSHRILPTTIKYANSLHN